MHWNAINAPRIVAESAAGLPDTGSPVVNAVRGVLQHGDVLWAFTDAVWDASQMSLLVTHRAPDTSGALLLDNPLLFDPSGMYPGAEADLPADPKRGSVDTVVESENLCGVVWFTEDDGSDSRVLVPVVSRDDGERDRVVAVCDMAFRWEPGSGNAVSQMWVALLGAPLERTVHTVDGRRVIQITGLR